MQPIKTKPIILNNALLHLADKIPAQPTIIPNIKPLAELKDAVTKNPAVFDDNTNNFLCMYRHMQVCGNTYEHNACICTNG